MILSATITATSATAAAIPHKQSNVNRPHPVVHVAHPVNALVKRLRRMEVSMGQVFAIAAVMALLGSSPGAAQMSAFGAPPDAGSIPPLGTISQPSSLGGGAIPLGTIELFVGGLSPAPLGPVDSTTVCPGPASSGAPPSLPSPASPSNVFDTGGTTAISTSPGTSSGCGTPGTGFPVTTGLSSVPGTAAVTSSTVTALGGNIAVGSTALSGAGLSGPITVPVPTASATLCPGPSGILTRIPPALGSGSPYVGLSATGTSLPFGC